MVLIHLVTAGVGMLEKLKETFRSGKRRPSEAFTQPVRSEHPIKSVCCESVTKNISFWKFKIREDWADAEESQSFMAQR